MCCIILIKICVFFKCMCVWVCVRCVFIRIYYLFIGKNRCLIPISYKQSWTNIEFSWTKIVRSSDCFKFCGELSGDRQPIRISFVSYSQTSVRQPHGLRPLWFTDQRPFHRHSELPAEASLVGKCHIKARLSQHSSYISSLKIAHKCGKNGKKRRWC